MRTRKKDDFDDEILALGGRIYALPRLSFSRPGTGIRVYADACRRFFEEHQGTWSVVQGHMTSTAAIYLAAAKRAGVPLTIAHARSAGTDPGLKGLLTKVLRVPLSAEGSGVRLPDGRRVPLADRRFACSHEAARAVFGHAEAVILPNAIRVDRFLYDPGVRKELREELGLAGCLVIGHVGSFRYAKNHEFLLRVFAHMTGESVKGDLPVSSDASGAGDLRSAPTGAGKETERLRLILLGDGTLFEETKALARSLGVEDRVIFAGNRSDVWRYYQVMDVLAFPSRYEGLPGTVVEAQAAGLPCLISDRITKDVDVTPLAHRAEIGKDSRQIEQAQADWAGRLGAMLAQTAGRDRKQASEQARKQLKAAGFDVDSQAKRLMELYCTGIWE